MKRILLLFCALAILLGCEKKQEAKELLRVGLMPDVAAIPFVIAEEQGFFADNVKLEFYRSPADRDSALQTGNLDGTSSDMLALFLLNQGGYDLVATSPTYGRHGIVLRPNSGVSDLKGLAGKQVAMTLNTLAEYMVDAIVTRGGGDPKSLVKVAVPQIPSRLELLKSSQVDAASMPEPFVYAASVDGLTVLATSDAYGLEVNPAMMMFTGDAYKNRRAELKSFYEAVDKAVDYINIHDQAEFMPSVIEKMGFPANVSDIKLPVYKKYELPDETEFNSAMQWLIDRDMLQKSYSYTDLVKQAK